MKAGISAMPTIFDAQNRRAPRLRIQRRQVVKLQRHGSPSGISTSTGFPTLTVFAVRLRNAHRSG
jgi:hypothetical protein